MSENKITWVFLGTALLAVGWGIWLKLGEPKPAEQESDWVIRDGKLVERTSSEPFQGVHKVPFVGAEHLIRWEYTYVDGVRQGPAIEFFPTTDRIVKSRSTYVGGKKAGPVITFFRSGLREFEGVAVDGFLNGLVTFYDEDGTVRGRNVYERSLPSGTAAITVDPVLVLEPEKEHDETVIDQVDPPPRLLLDPAGAPFTGVQTGTFFGGAKAFEHHYLGGRESGTQQGWDPSGEAEYERPYLGGKNHGTWKLWGGGGKVLSEKKYRHGRQIGESRTWFPDGKPREESQFVHGAEHGTRSNSDSRGNKRRETVYDHGIQVSLIEWDAAGKVVKDSKTPLRSGAKLSIAPAGEPVSKTVPIADLPADLDGEAVIGFRYRLSSDEEEIPADAARKFRISLLHDGSAREFKIIEGEIGGWRSDEWLARIDAGESLVLQVAAQPGSLQIEIDGIGYVAESVDEPGPEAGPAPE